MKVASVWAVLHIQYLYTIDNWQWSKIDNVMYGGHNHPFNYTFPDPKLSTYLSLYIWTKRSEYVFQMKGLWLVRRMAVLVAEGVFVVRSCRSHINQHLKTEAHFHSGKQTGIELGSRQNTTDGTKVRKIQIQTWTILFPWRVSESRHRTGLE